MAESNMHLLFPLYGCILGVLEADGEQKQFASPTHYLEDFEAWVEPHLHMEQRTAEKT
jgi:hypothetical protein